MKILSFFQKGLKQEEFLKQESLYMSDFRFLHIWHMFNRLTSIICQLPTKLFSTFVTWENMILFFFFFFFSFFKYNFDYTQSSITSIAELLF